MYNPSLEFAFKLARFFDVRLEDMFIYEDERDKCSGAII
jgi:putative transcriptional regulator